MSAHMLSRRSQRSGAGAACWGPPGHVKCGRFEPQFFASHVLAHEVSKHCDQKVLLCHTTAGSSRRVLGLLRGAPKGVVW